MSQIIYIEGDATKPTVDGCKIIAHLCNNIGVMGAGIARTIRNQYPLAYNMYISEHEDVGLDLGFSQIVCIRNDLYIANMVSQNGINDSRKGWRGDLVDYNGLRKCLDAVFQFAKDMNATVHMPRIGCGLAGSSWRKIEPLLIDVVGRYGVNCYVYDYYKES